MGMGIIRGGSIVGLWMGAMVPFLVSFSCESFLIKLSAIGNTIIWEGPWPLPPLDQPLSFVKLI